MERENGNSCLPRLVLVAGLRFWNLNRPELCLCWSTLSGTTIPSDDRRSALHHWRLVRRKSWSRIRFTHRDSQVVLAVLWSSKISRLLPWPNQVQEVVGDNHKGLSQNIYSSTIPRRYRTQSEVVLELVFLSEWHGQRRLFRISGEGEWYLSQSLQRRTHCSLTTIVTPSRDKRDCTPRKRHATGPCDCYVSRSNSESLFPCRWASRLVWSAIRKPNSSQENCNTQIDPDRKTFYRILLPTVHHPMYLSLWLYITVHPPLLNNRQARCR